MSARAWLRRPRAVRPSRRTHARSTRKAAGVVGVTPPVEGRGKTVFYSAGPHQPHAAKTIHVGHAKKWRVVLPRVSQAHSDQRRSHETVLPIRTRRTSWSCCRAAVDSHHWNFQAGAGCRRANCSRPRIDPTGLSTVLRAPQDAVPPLVHLVPPIVICCCRTEPTGAAPGCCAGSAAAPSGPLARRRVRQPAWLRSRPRTRYGCRFRRP